MSVFSTPPPAFSIEEAEAMVFDFYGLIVRASALNSERDQNFLCSTPDDQKIVLKISNPDEDKAVLVMQNECMKYIHDHDARLQVPLAIAGNAGNDIFVVNREATTYLVRTVSYLPGLQLKDVAHHESMLYELGSFLGSLRQAMSGFDHYAASRDFPWDIAYIDFIKAHKRYLPEGEEIVDYLENSKILMKERPNYVLILAWHLWKPIVKKWKSRGLKTKFIIPLPKFKIV